jgi:hypothetical protein
MWHANLIAEVNAIALISKTRRPELTPPGLRPYFLETESTAINQEAWMTNITMDKLL